jgi:arylsulfatase
LTCASEARPPNLLLIVVDTLRADRLACYGGPADLGRSMCALADRGTRFVWAVATAPYTAPSVASILTSRYPSTHGLSQFSGDPLADEIGTLAEVLSGAGYDTAAFVSNPVIRRQRALDRGFAIYDDRLRRRERNRPRYRERVAAHTTNAALAWARDAVEPWFLFVHYQDPHGPYAPPGSGAAEDAAGDDALPVLADNSGFRGIPSYQAIEGAFSARTYERRYAQEIRYLDGHVQRLVAGLDALGARPAVLLTADHGEALGEDEYYFAHGHSLGIDQIRVPLLWRPAAPGRPRVHPDAVSTLDVAPTLVRAAGLALPEGFQGRPLPVDRASARESAAAQRAIFSEHPARSAIVVGGTYFARDLVALEGPVVDPNTGGRLHPLQARAARLDAGDEPPTYEPIAPGTALEPHESMLRRHVERTESARDAAQLPPDAEWRELLRELGYVE